VRRRAGRERLHYRQEKQTNNYSRNGKTETVTVQMRAHGWALNGKEIVEDTGTGTAKVDIQFDSPQQSNIAGAYWRLDLPAALFSGGNVQIIGAVKPTPEKVSLAPGLKDRTITCAAPPRVCISHPAGAKSKSHSASRPRSSFATIAVTATTTFK